MNGQRSVARYGPIKQYDASSRIAWQMPREQFAYMAQQLLENVVTEFVSNAMNKYGMWRCLVCGRSDVQRKGEHEDRMLDGLKRWHIFPHMGDGGIALGAAMQANYELNGNSAYAFGDLVSR